MSVEITKKIETCDQCDDSKVTKVYTTDLWDNARKVFCNKLNKVVHSYLDWYDDANIPKECPYRREEKGE